ncbi:MAG: AAA family ATPase [Candidatus Babeliales bacterium]
MNIKNIPFLCIIFVTTTIPLRSSAAEKKHQGTLIVLNGLPASGKTTIQQRLQEKSDKVWLAMGIDSLLFKTLPSNYMSGEDRDNLPNKKQVAYLLKGHDQNDAPHTKVQFGPIGHTIAQGMFQAVAAYVRAGNNVIFDLVLFDTQWIDYAKKAFDTLKVYGIGLTLPLTEQQKRETDRGTTTPGIGNAHYHTVHAGITYDLMFDTSKVTVDEAVDAILNSINA